MLTLIPSKPTSDERVTRFAARLSDEQLAVAMSALVKEYVGRATASREMELAKARELWPHIRSALRASGRRISQVHWDGPVLTSWCFYPVAACDTYHGRKPRSKKAAMRIALEFGYHWATVGELWQWLHGSGPIVQRTMYALGYGGPGSQPASRGELYPWPPPIKDAT